MGRLWEEAMRGTAAAALGALVGCGSPHEETDHPAEVPGRTPVAASFAGPPASDDVVRAEEILVGRVSARFVLAEVVEARGGRIERVVRLDDKRWQAEIEKRRLELSELTAERLYVKVLKAGWLEAGEVHAKEVKLDHAH